MAELVQDWDHILRLSNDFRPRLDRTGSPGVHAALSVLEALEKVGPLGLTELADEIGVPKSTLHRICGVLVSRGWSVRQPDGRFNLGIRAIGIGSRSSELPLITAFRSAAADLICLHNETIALAVLDNDESVYIALEETSHVVRLVTSVGSRTPAYASASGRIILSGFSDDEICTLFEHRILETPTGKRLRDLNELLAVIDESRQQGVSFNVEETAHGLFALSAPVRNESGKILAAITMCVPTSRVTPELQELFAKNLVRSARQLSEDVSWLSNWDGTRF